MKKIPDKINGVDADIAHMIYCKKPFSLSMKKDNKIYERLFTPSGSSPDKKDIFYNHKKLTYQIQRVGNREFIKLIDTKQMPESSTISYRIFQTLQVLLASGYRYTTMKEI